MSRLADTLAAVANAPPGEALVLAEAALADPSLAADAAAEVDALLAAVTALVEGLRGRARAAFAKVPAVRGGGFHSGAPDSRPFALYRTVSLLREAGAYAPEELRARLAEGAVRDTWAAAECLRLAAILAEVGHLMDAVVGAEVAAADYAARVRAVVLAGTLLQPAWSGDG